MGRNFVLSSIVAFLGPEAYRLANQLYSDKEGNHVNPIESSLTWHLGPRLFLTNHYLHELAQAGACINIQIYSRVI